MRFNSRNLWFTVTYPWKQLISIWISNETIQTWWKICDWLNHDYWYLHHVFSSMVFEGMNIQKSQLSWGLPSFFPGFDSYIYIYIYISIPYQITKYIGRNYACYFPMNWYFNIGIITIGMSSGMNKWFQSFIAVDCRYNIRLLIITVCACMCMYTYIYICTPFDLSQFLPIGITIYYSTISTIY